MFIEIVRNMESETVSNKLILEGMAKAFEDNLPNTLYLDHYKLADEYGFSAAEWDRFLRIPEVDRMVEREMAQIAEIAARDALKRLSSGKAASADIQAAKELLSNSKLLKQKTNQRPNYIVTRIPEKEE